MRLVEQNLSLVPRWLMCSSALVLCLAVPALAGPEGPVTIAGTATIESSGPSTTIKQSTDRAIIRWDKFDLREYENVDFQQPSSSSITVNRIRDSKASQIDGHITANGNIMLLNPNGVIFGLASRVDVGGIVSSSSDLEDDADFLLGGNVKLTNLGNGDSKIENYGQIQIARGGLAGFVAPQVENHGIIQATLGNVTLASGDITTIDFAGDGLIQVEVSDTVKKQLVKNTGTLNADGGAVKISAAAARDVVNSLIEVSGHINTRSVGNRAGEIDISAQGSNAVEGNLGDDNGKKSGGSKVIIKDALLDVSGKNVGERGGKLTVTGDNIALLNNTFIDASGHTGLTGTTNEKLVSDYRDGSAGGDILIGGDYLGQGDTSTAKNLYVESGVVVLNDSLNEGDAGRTIFWSDNTTQFHGKVYARAFGNNGGNGGFVETSGKENLISSGNVDAGAVNGLGGIWLLDPSDVTIASGAGADVNATVFSGTWTPTVGASTSTIFVDNINTALTGGTSVLINTSSSGGGSGDITLGAGANISTGTSANLTLDATRNITLTGNITLGTGALTLNAAGGNISGAGNIVSSGSRDFNVGSGSGIYSGVLSGIGSLTKSGAGTLILTGANTYTGNTTVSAGTLIVSGQQYFNVGRTTSIASGATFELLNSTNNFTTQMPLSTVNGAGTLRFSGTSSLNQSSGGSTNQNRFVLSQSAGGLLDLQGTSSLLNGGWQNINWTGNSGSLNIASGASFDVWDGNAVRIDGLTGSGTINKGNAGTVNVILGVNGGSGTFSGTIANILGTITLTKSGAGTQTFTGNNTYTGTTTISAGTLQIGNGGTTGTLGTANVVNNGNLSFNRSDMVTIPNVISGTGSVSQLGTGATTLTAANTYSGITTISAGTLQIGNNGTTGTLGSGAVINNAALIIDRSNAMTINNTISGTGSLTKLRANILTLGAGKSYSGTTTISAGTLQAASTSSFSANSAVTVASGATVDIAGWNNSIGSLAGAGTVTNSNATTATLTSGGDNTSTTFSGIVQNGTGTINLTKSGTGTFTLSGTNTYTGATTINAGTLQVLNTSTVSNVGVLGSGSIAVGSGSVLQYTNSRTTNDSYLIANTISGAGSLLFDGPDGSITTLSTAKTYTGGTTILSGVVNLGNNTAFGTGTVTMTGGAIRATLAPRTLGNAFNLNGTIGLGQSTNITGGITLGGNTTITCSSNCGLTTFSGPIALGANTLSLSNTGPNTLGGLWTGNTLTLSGIISGTGGITQASTGTLTLSGANTYTGATTINSGTLALGANNALANTGAVVVNASGATFNLAGFTDTIASLTSVAGSTVTLGNGNLTTSGSQTYGGQVTGGNVTLTSTGGGAITATDATNNFTGTLNISTTGAISIVDANALTLGTVSGSTISAQTLGVTSDLTLAGNLNASATSGDSIVFAAGRDLDNSGNRTLTTAGSARWQIYSGDTANITQSVGGLIGYNRYGCTYNAGTPNCAAGTNIPVSGNGFYYAFAPTLTITPTAIAALTYGDSTPSLVGYAYGVTGYLGGDSGLDTLSGSLTGSTLYTPTSNVNNYNINYASGVLTSTLGYGFSYTNNSSAITVNKANLLATANSQTITFGTAVPSSTITYTGFVNSENSSVIDTLATLNSVNSGIVNEGTYVGNYTASGAFDNNYNFNYATGDLIVLNANQKSSSNNFSLPSTFEKSLFKISFLNKDIYLSKNSTDVLVSDTFEDIFVTYGSCQKNHQKSSELCQKVSLQ